jgi:hypothetical protein
VCADTGDLGPNGQLVPKSLPIKPDGGADALGTDVAGKDANLGTGGTDLAVGSPDSGGGVITEVAAPEPRQDAPVDLPGPKLPDAGADLATVSPDATTNTPAQTVALFHFDGTQGSTNLVDSSGTGKVATITGNPIISTAQSKFGGASLYVNGTSVSETNYMRVDGGDDFTFAGDFTMDWWQYVIAYTNSFGSFVNVLTPADKNTCAYCAGAAWNSSGGNFHFINYPKDSVAAPTKNAWHHVALTRAGSAFMAFIDGHLVATDVSTATIRGQLGVTGTAGNSDNGDFNGYIDELRVVKGTAVWTSDFTPPTAPYVAGSIQPTDGGAPDLPAATPDSSASAPETARPDVTQPTPDAIIHPDDGGESPVPTGCTVPSSSKRYFCDDFESGLSNWVVSGQDWNTTSATWRSPTHSATNAPNGNYPGAAIEVLAMASSVDLTTATTPVLSFWNKLVYGPGNDFDDVDVSSDGGSTWTNLREGSTECCWVNDSSSSWTPVQLSLSSYVGKKVKIRFRYRTANGVVAGTPGVNGWYIDDVEIREAN